MINKQSKGLYVELRCIRGQELYVVVLKQLLVHRLGFMLASVVHHVDVVLVCSLVHEPLCLLRSQ
jgi:hypothetical protein